MKKEGDGVGFDIMTVQWDVHSMRLPWCLIYPNHRHTKIQNKQQKHNGHSFSRTYFDDSIFSRQYCTIYLHNGFFIKSGTAGSTAVLTHVYTHSNSAVHASLAQPRNPRLHNEAPSLVRALSDTHNAVTTQHKHTDDWIIRGGHVKLY